MVYPDTPWKDNLYKQLSDIITPPETTRISINIHTIGLHVRKDKRNKKPSIIKNIIRSNKTDYWKLKKLFSSLSLPEIRSSTRELYNNKDFNKYIQLDKTSDTTNIYNYHIPETTLDKSLYWCMGIFINNNDKLNKFVELEQKISDSLLNDKLEHAIVILDEIDRLCGISIWSISLRSSILIENGERGQVKNYLNKILSGVEQFDMFHVIANLMVNKNDSNNSINENRIRMNRQLHSSFYLDSPDLYYFLKYKVLSFKPTEDYNFEHILNIEKNSTLIDLFICCGDFVTYSVLHNIHEELTHELVKVIGHHIPNSIFHRYGDRYEPRSNWSVDASDVDLLDNYTKGNYEYCYNKVLNLEMGLGFSHIEIAAKSACRLNNQTSSTNKGKIILLLKDFLIKRADYHGSKNEIYRIQNKFRDLYLYKKLIIFIELSEIRLNETIRAGLKRTLSLVSKINSPFRSEFIHPESREVFIRAMENAKYIETTLIWKLYQGEIAADSAILENVYPERKQSYHCKYLMKSGETLKGQGILSELALSKDKLISYEASNNLLVYYNANEMDLDAVTLYNKSVLSNRNHVYTLDNDKAIISAERILQEDLNITAIITLSIASRYIDSSMSSKLRAIFNSLMRIYKCTNPLELNSCNQWSNNEYIYFLRYICTPKIMKFFRHFKTPTEIDKCRINICNYLMTVDKDKDIIENELKDITKKLVLREATLQVAQSKVDSDISALKSGENVSHISLYEEYMNYVRDEYGEFTKSVFVYEFMGLISEDSNVGVTFLNGSKNLQEIKAIFIKLVRTVIEEFSFGEKGLNANVSTRIRHGHLPNTIRRSLLNENLITSISEQTKVVKTNDFWLSKLSECQNYDSISKALNNFTLLVNGLIHTINEEVLQVSTLDENLSKLSKAEKPLFSYKPSDLEILLLQKKINLSTTYNDFINIVENWLWDITQNNLDLIREYISEKVSDQLIGNLITEMSKLIENQPVLYEFTNAANRAKIAFRNDINTIISWFKKQEISSSSKFDLEIAVKIASQALLMDIDLSAGNDIQIKGDKLSCFVDILYILYENSISKSGVNKEELNIKHFAKLDNNNLQIFFSNKCEFFNSPHDKNLEIQEYIDSYGTEDKMMQRLHSEGGTGFAKIWKVITKDLGCKHTIDFGFRDNSNFIVDININVSELFL